MRVNIISSSELVSQFYKCPVNLQDDYVEGNVLALFQVETLDVYDKEPSVKFCC